MFPTCGTLKINTGGYMFLTYGTLKIKIGGWDGAHG